MPVHYQFVSQVVGLRKEVVVGGRDEKSRGERDSSEPEEVSHVHESYRVECAHRDIKLGVLEGEEGIALCVIALPELSVEHKVSHCIVLVPQVVLHHVRSSLVEAPVPVLCVSFLLVSVAQVVEESDEGVFEGNPLLGLGVDVEGEVVVTLDVHELVVEVQHW